MMYALSHALNELKHRDTSTIGMATVVNSQIHKQAAEFSSYYSNPLQLADKTMDSILSRVNPELWMFVAESMITNKYLGHFRYHFCSNTNKDVLRIHLVTQLTNDQLKVLVSTVMITVNNQPMKEVVT